MFKNKPTMEVEGAEGRIHMYMCPADTPKGEAFDILGKMRDHLFAQIKADNEAEKAKEEAEKSTECGSCVEDKCEEPKAE